MFSFCSPKHYAKIEARMQTFQVEKLVGGGHAIEGVP